MTLLEKRLEVARSALKAIHTWATFEYQGLPPGHALVPKQVAELCRKTLAETENPEPTRTP